jgi:hypothetical protein
MNKCKLYSIETSPGLGVLVNILRPDDVDFRLLHSAVRISDKYFEVDTPLRIMMAYEAMLHFMTCEDYEKCRELKLALQVYWITTGRHKR